VLESHDSGQDPEFGFCEHGNGSSGFIKYNKFDERIATISLEASVKCNNSGSEICISTAKLKVSEEIHADFVSR
jgi:hypothetical protein